MSAITEENVAYATTLTANSGASLELTVEIGASPQPYDLVFCSVDSEGAGGELSQYIEQETGVRNLARRLRPAGKITTPRRGMKLRAQLAYVAQTDNFAIFPIDSRTYVLIVSVGGLATSTLLLQNLSQALAALLEDEVAPKRIWLPLMGTGAGGLSFERSAEFIAGAIKDVAADLVAKGVKRICVSAPATIASSELAGVVEPFRVWFGGEAKGENPDAGAKLIERIQRLLNDSGSTPSTLIADGVAGPATRAAVAAWASNAAFDWSGEFDDALHTALQLDLGPRRDEAEIHADRPVEGVEDDAFDRKAIADAIAGNVQAVWADHERRNQPFIVHLSGRWGAGKSSILNFLRSILTEPDDQGRVWTIAEFNAWREHGHGHAWWSLLNTLERDAADQAPFWLRRRLKFANWWWRLMVGWRPWIIGGLATLAIVGWAVVASQWDAARPTTHTRTETFDSDSVISRDGVELKGKAVDKIVTVHRQPGKGFVDILLLIGSVVTTAMALAGVVMTFTARSKRTAEAVLEMDTNALAPLSERYARVVRKLAERKGPVAVFIDDLDRCDAEYVLEVLQSLQTAYGDSPVLYVVAADRNWIISAYEQVYRGFSKEIARPGRPLGYLFLAKIFQLSVDVPNMSPGDRERFLGALLDPASGPAAADPEAKAQIERDIDAAGSEAEIRQTVEDARKAGLGREAVAAAASRLQDAELQAEIRHRLLDYAKLIGPNPREIKRLVNAYSFKQTYAFLGGLDIAPDALARWCILELRFPRAADLLAEDPTLRHADPTSLSPQDQIVLAPPAIAEILETLDDEAFEAVTTLS